MHDIANIHGVVAYMECRLTAREGVVLPSDSRVAADRYRQPANVFHYTVLRISTFLTCSSYRHITLSTPSLSLALSRVRADLALAPTIPHSLPPPSRSIPSILAPELENLFP